MTQFNIRGQAIGFEKISVGNSEAVGLTAAEINPTNEPPAYGAFITVADQTISVKMDGGTPTASDGHLVTTTDSLVVHGTPNLNNLKMIATTGTAVVSVTYLR